jgi:hypothetical protein
MKRQTERHACENDGQIERQACEQDGRTYLVRGLGQESLRQASQKDGIQIERQAYEQE